MSSKGEGKKRHDRIVNINMYENNNSLSLLPAAKNVHPFFETNNVLGEIVITSSSFPTEEIHI